MSNPKRPKTVRRDGIPMDVKLQILHKLPIKSLIRFTCVSKTWLSQINNPNFISNHLDLTISAPTKDPLLLRRICSNPNNNPNEHYSLLHDNHNLAHYMHLHCPFEKQSPYFRVVGTVHGLICLVDNATHKIVIWNPIIRKYLLLPPPTITGHIFNLSYGFGFDSNVNDYKVLRLVRLPRNKKEEKEDKDDQPAEVYSLNLNSWRRIGGIRIYDIKWSARQVFVNGLIHFLASRREEGDRHGQNLIVGFNLGLERFDEIMMPDDLVKGFLPLLNVFLCDQSIAVVEDYHGIVPHGGSGRHVWVMGVDGLPDSWTKIFSFKVLQPVLGFRKNRELIIQRYRRGIGSFNAESGEFKSFGIPGSQDYENAFADYFVESMELLNNANAVSVANLGNHAIGGDAPAVGND